MIDTLFIKDDKEKGIGHCGKRCLSECDFRKEKGNEEGATECSV